MAKRACLRIWTFIQTLLFGSHEVAREPIELQGTEAKAWNPGGLKHIEDKPAQNRTATDDVLTQQGPLPPPTQPDMPPQDGWPWDDTVDDDWAALTA